MRLRASTLVAAALVALAGFAVADALRDVGSSSHATGSVTSRQASTEPTSPLSVGLLRGRLVFTDESCDVRVLELEHAADVPATEAGSNCFLSGPGRSTRIAFGAGPLRAGALSFSVARLGRRDNELGPFRERPGSLVWSRDGRRLAWCAPTGEGVELAAGGRTLRLPGCPVGYSGAGEPVYVRGRRVIVGGRTVLRAPSLVTAASIDSGGSVAVALDAGSIQVYRNGLEPIETTIPRRVRAATPIFAPDNCGALFLTPHRGRSPRVVLLDLGCLRGQRRDLSGLTAAWSPDGEWFAVAEERTIAFYPVDASRAVLRYPATANQLVWQE